MKIEPDDEPDTWRAVDADGRIVGVARVLRRPDDRRILLRRSHDPAVRAELLTVAEHVPGDLYLITGEDETPAGFTVSRREHLYRIPVRQQPGTIPPGYTVVSAGDADEDRLRELDDALRQDIPGADGWHSTPEEFRRDTYGEDFDPATYLVAVDATGTYAGLVRVWRNAVPRLGMIAIVPEHRNRGLARGLLALVFAVLRDRGHDHVTTEVDESNLPSNTLMRSLGAERTGGEIEWVRPAQH